LAAWSRKLGEQAFPRYIFTMQNEDDHMEKRRQPAAPRQKREDRLKAELRANLVKRKLQARARRQGAEDARPGALMPGDDGETG
jgi:hypothetical protein